MSNAAGESSWASRWRAAYDIALGVVLFLVLLVPAVRQASTGTSAGLRNGMLLLLVDLVVLVMLSRYLTHPAREPLWGRGDAEPVLPPAQLAALLDERGAPSPELGLVLSDADIGVRQGAGDHGPMAHLAWSDCVAVVASEIDVRDGSEMVFLQFVAAHEDRIRFVRGLRRTRGAARLLGVSEAAGAMVWGVPSELVPVLAALLGHVEQHHPHVRIVLPD